MPRPDDAGRFNPSEIAVLVVNGTEFYDWLSIEVKIEIAAYASFSFTCTEFSPIPSAWTSLKFKPGDKCDVYLGGVHVLKGYILTRQVAYDGKTHAVQLSGVSLSFDIASSSIVTQAGNYDGYDWKRVTESLIKPFGVPLKVEGNISSLPFKNLQIQPGELVWSCIERLATQRKIRLGSTGMGEVLAIGDHQAGSGDGLVEGENILRARCIISDVLAAQKYIGQGQDTGNDEKWGDDVSKQRTSVSGSLQRFKQIIVSSETPDSDEGLKLRVQMEHNHSEGTKVEAQIVVQGWFSPSGKIWNVRQYPFVRSPMLMVEEPLGVRAVTFRQSVSEGTTTTLDVISPIWMNGGPNYSLGAP